MRYHESHYDGTPYETWMRSIRNPKRLTDEEASRVVLPTLPTCYATSEHGYGYTYEIKYARRDRHGRPVVRSDGKGRLKSPIGGEYIDAEDKNEVVRRYLVSVGASPKCCTLGKPCSKHKAALWGRDWKTEVREH